MFQNNILSNAEIDLCVCNSNIKKIKGNLGRKILFSAKISFVTDFHYIK